ncbi:hypothetical protein BDV93DRAFT_445072, partial [Ceratobasidium sp. AG-I]
TARARSIPSLNERPERLGAQVLEDPSMDEEQEREVSHEIECEPQTKRPPKSQPNPHSIHPDLTAFVLTGSIPRNSSGFLSLFHPVQEFQLPHPSPWSNSLLATAYFSETLHKSPDNELSDYMRPLNWIASGSSGVLVALSPYEANELLPYIRASRNVRLHVYAPRVTQAMKSFSDLQFYSVPSLPVSGWSPPSPRVQLQLNLWAGQLYFKDYDEYRSLCAFLGVYLETGARGEEDVSVRSDGFVLPTDRYKLARYHPEYASCGFVKSPVNLVKRIISRRRRGMEYLRTNLGQVLHARSLDPDGF